MKDISRKDPNGSASAAETLRAVNSSDQATVNTTLNYLLTSQNSDGGWGTARNEESDVSATATVILTLQQYPQTDEIYSIINRAAGYLMSKQNADGGFGSKLSTVLETANAYIALASVISDPVILGNATNYLVSSQFSNGSWNDDPCSTALALRAFSCIEARPVLLPQDKTDDHTVETGFDLADQPHGSVEDVAAAPAEDTRGPADTDPVADKKLSLEEPDEDSSVRDDHAADVTKEDEITRETKEKGAAVKAEAPQREERTTKVSLVTRRKSGSSFATETPVSASESDKPRVSAASSRGTSGTSSDKAFAGVSQQPTARMVTITAAPIDTDKKEYRAHDVVTISSEISNKSDTAVNLQISSRITDNSARVIGSASLGTGSFPQLPPSCSETAVLLWNTERHQPGTYGIELSIADASSGDILDEKKVAIDIVPTVSIDGTQLSVNPLHLDINETKNIVLTVSFNNRSNVDASLAARYMIKDTEGNSIHNGLMDFKLAMSEPLMVLDLPNFTHTFDQSGQYLVETEIMSGDEIVYAHAQAAIRVSSTMQIEVKKTLEPAVVTPDGDKQVRMGIRLEGTGIVTSPVVLSAMTNTAGDGIIVAFDKAMTDPSGEQDQFVVAVDKTVIPVAGVTLKGSDITKINISLGSPLDQYQAVMLSYVAGEVTSMDGKPLLSFEKQAVINKVSPPIFNQDGFGYSGRISPDPLEENIIMTGYNQWPKGFYKSVLAFAGGIFDGQSVWMVPANADSMVKINKDTGVMTGYSKWPKGFRKGNLAFAGGIFDGRSIWMVPANADRVVRIDTATGEMTGYKEWPEGSKMVEYAFAGGVFDGRNIWMIPYYADRVVRIDTATGEMTGCHQRPEGMGKTEYAFAGGIFDGQSIWMVPLNADRVIRINKDTAETTEYDKWPAGFSKGVNAFAGGVFDGRNIWMVPSYADKVMRISSFTSLSVSANLAANDSFYFYISQDEFAEGNLIGQGKGWSSVYSVNAALVPGVTNYLHVKSADSTGPVAAFIGDFAVNDKNFHFMNGTQRLLTGEDCWDVYSGSFGVKQEKVTTVCKNGLGPWSTRFGIDLNANWIWTGEGKDLATRYFSTPIYYSAVSVDPIKDIRLIDTIGGVNVIVDKGSFSRQPDNMMAENNTTVIEWRFEKILMGQREEVFFDILVKDPAAGEDRQVSSGLDIVYSDSEGKPVKKEFGPSSIHVIDSAFVSAITTSRPVYKANDDVKMVGTIKNLSERGRTLDVKVLIEDGQGVVLEESTITGIALSAGEERKIDDLIFKIIATNAGDHRAHLIAYEDRKQVSEARAGFMIEEAPPKKEATPKKEAPSKKETSSKTHDLSAGDEDNVADGPEDIAGPIPDTGEEVRAAREDTTDIQGQAGGSEAGTISEISGTITAQPELIYKGLSETITYALENSGVGEDMSKLAVSLAIVDPVSCETRQVIKAPKAHFKGNTFEGVFTFSTATYEPGRYAAVLQVARSAKAEPISVASTYFEVRLISVVVT